jgi:Family of unknown function (DUF6098)
VRDSELSSIDSLEEVADLVRSSERRLFVRYSRGPDHDRARRSRDYESGLELPGLSVNPLDPEPWWTRPLEDWLARQLCNYLHLQEEADDERRAWMLGGELAGRGPDNEPLLGDVEPVAWIDDRALSQARDRYKRCFDVGRDST